MGVQTQTIGLTSGMTTSAFARGYTVIMGDSGHDSSINTYPNAGGASAFARDPQARVDFGHASYNLVAQVGKALSLAYYAKPSQRAYFSACSDGGRQAVGQALHYPQNFDGILATASAVDIPHMTAYVPLILQTLGPIAKAAGQVDANGRPLINKVYSNVALQLVSQAVLQACDKLDGLQDGMVNHIDDTQASITHKTAVYPQAVVDWGLMNSPDLSAFKRRGGKMIAWTGNADPAVSPRDTINWYKGVDAHEGGQAANFLRLFMVPGMNHCAGGVATDRFDMLTPLEDWVERGIAPASVPAQASNPGYFGVASRTRPLCPYPQYAHYNGSGSIDLASNFSCR